MESNNNRNASPNPSRAGRTSATHGDARGLSPHPQAERTFSGSSTGSLSHRSSFASDMRPHPPSPRSQRHPSLSQAAVQELLNNPPTPKKEDLRFKGRDWRQIKVGELVSSNDVRFVQLDTTVEDATKLLVDSGSPHVVLVRENPDTQVACSSFDYNDLNAYLLVVLGIAPAEPEEIDKFAAIANNAREGQKVPIGDITTLAKKAPLVTLSQDQDISAAMEQFASGVHRVLIVKEGTHDVIGVLSQFRLVNFLWENGSCFSVIDHLYPRTLRDLEVGSSRIICINGDKPLTEALLLMNAESLSSLAVVDNAMNVIGNISAADVKHLTKTSSLPLLQSSCIHFISVILSERGVENGKDAFPVFYVSPYSTLAHTVAKLVATASHRMWVTEGQSPAQTPSVQPISLSLPSVATAPHAPVPALPALAGSGSPPASPAFPSISAAAYPGARTSGQIAGVVSLTDILNLFAKHSGLVTGDPSEERWARRRSSSVSSKQRPSFDISGARDGALSGSAIADAVPTPVRASGSAISGRERSVDQQKRQ